MVVWMSEKSSRRRKTWEHQDTGDTKGVILICFSNIKSSLAKSFYWYKQQLEQFPWVLWKTWPTGKRASFSLTSGGYAAAEKKIEKWQTNLPPPPLFLPSSFLNLWILKSIEGSLQMQLLLLKDLQTLSQATPDCRKRVHKESERWMEVAELDKTLDLASGRKDHKLF